MNFLFLFLSLLLVISLDPISCQNYYTCPTNQQCLSNPSTVTIGSTSYCCPNNQAMTFSSNNQCSCAGISCYRNCYGLANSCDASTGICDCKYKPFAGFNCNIFPRLYTLGYDNVQSPFTFSTEGLCKNINGYSFWAGINLLSVSSNTPGNLISVLTQPRVCLNKTSAFCFDGTGTQLVNNNFIPLLSSGNSLLNQSYYVRSFSQSLAIRSEYYSFSDYNSQLYQGVNILISCQSYISCSFTLSLNLACITDPNGIWLTDVATKYSPIATYNPATKCSSSTCHIPQQLESQFCGVNTASYPLTNLIVPLDPNVCKTLDPTYLDAPLNISCLSFCPTPPVGPGNSAFESKSVSFLVLSVIFFLNAMYFL